MRRKVKKEGIKTRVLRFFFSAQLFPVFLTLTVISVLLVMFRMKSIEQEYKHTEVLRSIKQIKIENKELKAKKARNLSIKNLRKMANKFNFSQPSQDQIIVIPGSE